MDVVVDMARAKRRLRRAMASRRRALSPAARRTAGEAVARLVLDSSEYRSAERLALYAALPDELPCDLLLATALQDGRRILLPRIAAGDLLEFAPVRTPTELSPGRFGVYEPPPETEAEQLAPGDLVLVPGLAFDRAGGRLGRGSGYYDRSLADPGAAPTIFGVGFGFQLVDEVPREPHDRRVDAVVTEEGILRVREP